MILLAHKVFSCYQNAATQNWDQTFFLLDVYVQYCNDALKPYVRLLVSSGTVHPSVIFLNVIQEKLLCGRINYCFSFSFRIVHVLHAMV